MLSARGARIIGRAISARPRPKSIRGTTYSTRPTVYSSAVSIQDPTCPPSQPR